MWMTIVSFLGGPVITGLINAYSAHLKAQSADAATAANLAGKEIAAETAEVQPATQLKLAKTRPSLGSQRSSPFTSRFCFMRNGSCEDTILGLGSTAALKGDVSIWAGMIMRFYFTKRGFGNVAGIIRR